jgi:hypothetical protein
LSSSSSWIKGVVEEEPTPPLLYRAPETERAVLREDEEETGEDTTTSGSDVSSGEAPQPEEGA